MSEKQKQKTTTICPSCKNERVITVGSLQRIKWKGLDGKCQACKGKERQGTKMSLEARKKMSERMKLLVAQGLVPGKPFPKGNIPWSAGKKLGPSPFKGTHKKAPKICLHCNELFYGESRKGKRAPKFCSKQCVNRFKVADGTHHLWKGGITPLNTLIRASIEMREWKQKVFERDGYCCAECGIESTPGNFNLMHIDHIIPLSFLVKKNNIKTKAQAQECSELWDIKNGRVLCVPCHENTDTFLYRSLNYQLTEK